MLSGGSAGTVSCQAEGFYRFTRAFLTIVDTGFVKQECYNKGIECGFDSIET